MNWQESDDMLVGFVIIENFNHGVELLTKIAKIADELNHHPTVMMTYEMLTLTLTTHDEGDIITEKDYLLADRISALVAE